MAARSLPPPPPPHGCHVHRRLIARAVSTVHAPVAASVSSAYARLVEAGSVREDGAQRAVVQEVEAALARLRRYLDRRRAYEAVLAEWEQAEAAAVRVEAAAKTSVQARTHEVADEGGRLLPARPPRPSPPRLPKGLYVCGHVGSGKSMIMDLAYDAAVGGCTQHAAIPARRVHFHTFMQEVHTRIHAFKQELLAREGRSKHVDLTPERDAIAAVGRAIAAEAALLCFDEFQIHDVADALIVTKLFTSMFAAGCVVLATSNRAPQELYAGGLNRDYFLPFIHVLTAHCKVVRLDTGRDYRRPLEEQHERADDDSIPVAPAQRVFFYPATAEQRDSAIFSLFGGATAHIPSDDAASLAASLVPVRLPLLHGRFATVCVLSSSPHKLLTNAGAPVALNELVASASAADCAVVSYTELACMPRGVVDFASLFSRFAHVLVTDIPVLTREHINEAIRLHTAIDLAYEYRVRLLLHAATPPQHLFDAFLRPPLSARTITGGLDATSVSSTLAPTADASVDANVTSIQTEFAFNIRRTLSRLAAMEQPGYTLDVSAQDARRRMLASAHSLTV